ncbi:hypothetical protein [Shewanella maritima]|uniref:hypothetical protein n=1 Tax=Shewanella maritima TaxID=2520507 RepID=UPI0037358607
MFRASIIAISLWACSASLVFAQTMEVIALEYPPYISTSLPNNGEAFNTVQTELAKSGIDLQANFLPAARAFNEVSKNQWCASFHPPIPVTAQHTLVITKKELVQLRLHRMLEPNEFVGTEINGKVIAQLRMIEPKGVTKGFVDQGAELFLVESLPQAVSLLLKNRVDYIYADSAALEFAAKQQNLLPTFLQASSIAFREFPVGIWFNNQCNQSSLAVNVLKKQGYPVKTFTESTDKVNLIPGSQASELSPKYYSGLSSATPISAP